MEPASPIRVLLVDDHDTLRKDVRNFLKSYSDIEFVGEAIDGEEAVFKAEQLQPAVVLMDICLPRLDGIAATREIKVRCPHTLVIGLTAYAKGYYIDAMKKAGGVEIVSKENVFNLYGIIRRAVTSTPQSNLTS
jgi:DNA-binding NarL/FixJ family response regulator